MTDFDAVWAIAQEMQGWLTREQARALWTAAAEVPPGGKIVEIGSHRGRSTSVLASAAPTAAVIAIDPFDNPRWGGGPESRQAFLDNLNRAGVQNVELRADLSTELRPTWSDPIDLLYIDGAHDYPTVKDDFEWSQHVKPGGAVFVHDSFSSTGVTRALYERLLRQRDLRYVRRTRSLAEFRREPVNAASVAQAVGAGLWFGRNVAVKVCIKQGWQRPAALLGQADMQYPY